VTVNRKRVEDYALEGCVLLGASRNAAALLPRPLCLVEYFNRYEDHLANACSHWLLRLAHNYSALLLPLGPLFPEGTSIKLVICTALSLWVDTSSCKLASDYIEHVVGIVADGSAVAAPGSTSTTPVASPERLVAVFLVFFELLVVRVLVVCGDFIFLESGDDDCGGVLGPSDFDERMRVLLTVLAHLAIVEILAHRTLVTDSNYRVDTATVASHVVRL
jgi:hypothetical protein